MNEATVRQAVTTGALSELEELVRSHGPEVIRLEGNADDVLGLKRGK